mgnify:CR=1 FL=1
MRLLTFIVDGTSRLGLAVNGQIVDLALAYAAIPAAQREGPAALPSEMVAFLQAGDPAMQAARQVERGIQRGALTVGPNGEKVVYGKNEVRIAAPIARPGKIICLGLNYADHIAETGAQKPNAPILFAKFANAIIGPGEAIRLPRASQAVDYEAEMAFVIGKTARRVPLEAAYEYVAGYMNFNDVSARDLQRETSQWLRGKGADTFAPTGPYLVTRDEVPDPQTLDVRLWLNGQLMQNSNTKHLIFNVPFLVHHISKTMTLEPGDIVATGTPDGVGFARKPPVLLKEGDVVRIEIGNLGVLENPVVQDD